MQFLPWGASSRVVARSRGARGVRKPNCAQQFRFTAVAQLTRRESLRDLVACLDAVPAKRYHAGFTSPISSSALALANQRRSRHICEDLALRLPALGHCRRRGRSGNRRSRDPMTPTQPGEALRPGIRNWSGTKRDAPAGRLPAVPDSTAFPPNPQRDNPGPEATVPRNDL